MDHSLEDIFHLKHLPPPPTKEDSYQAFHPTPWRLDTEFWQQSKPLERYPDNPIVRYIDACIQNGEETIQYTHVANPKIEPRRLPIISPDLPEVLFLLSQNALTKDVPRYYLSTLPKSVRAVLQPLPGRHLLDFDLSQAHLSISGSLSKDTNLLEDLKSGDVHTRTGTLVDIEGLPPKATRKLGKRINNALNMGLTPHGLVTELNDFITDVGLTDHPTFTLNDATAIYEQWWSRYPDLLAFKRSHHQYIDHLRKNNQAYKIKYGRNMATYTVKDLHGINWHGEQVKTQTEVLLSTWSRFITSIEAALMEHIFVLAHQHGFKLGCPMYDGAMWQVPIRTSVLPFIQDVMTLISDWGLTMGCTRDFNGLKVDSPVQ